MQRLPLLNAIDPVAQKAAAERVVESYSVVIWTWARDQRALLSPISVILFDNYERMTGSELKRWLKAQGCTFQESTNHTKVTLGQNVTWLPRHWTKQVETGTLKKILKDLDLKI